MTAVLQWAYEAGSPAVLWQQRVLMVAYVFVALAFAGGVMRQLYVLWQREARVMALGLVVVFAVACLVRFAAPASLMDIHYRLEPALHPELTSARYGWGLPVLAQMLWAVFGRSDGVVFTANALIGALAVFPLYALAERLRIRPYARLWAIVVFALMPLHVRFSHTDNQSIVEVTLLLFALAACCRFIERGRARDGLVAAVALAVASSCRPEAIVLPLLVLSLVWALRPRQRLPWPAVGLAAGAYLVVAGGHLLAMLHLLSSDPNGPSRWSRGVSWHAGLSHFVFLNTAWTPVVLISVIVLGVVSPSVSWRVRIWLAVMALALAGLVWGFSPQHGGLLAARHQLRALPFVALLAGLGIALVLRSAERLSSLRHPRATLLGGGGMIALLFMHLKAAHTPTTLNLEYAFYAQTIGDVPGACTIVSWSPPRDRSLLPPRHLSEFAQREHRYIDIDDPAAACASSHPCAVYYRPASCFTHVPRAGEDAPQNGPPRLDASCARWEGMYALEPIGGATLPAVSSGTDLFTTSAVEVGWFSFSRRGGDLPITSCEDADDMDGVCRWGFTKAHTEEIQRVVREMSGADCLLRSVQTNGGRSQLLWSKAGRDAGSATLAGRGCETSAQSLVGEAEVLRLTADDALRKACPAALEQLKKRLQEGVFPEPAQAGPRH